MIEPGSPAANSLFLTWVDHRRTTEIAQHLGTKKVVLTTPRRGIARYFTLAGRTIGVLRRERAHLLIVQSPSLVLSLLALALRPLFRYALVVDAHNEAVEPYLHPNALMRALTYLVLRRADLVVVSNPALVSRVEQKGGRAMSLPDRIPTAHVQPPGAKAGNDFQVVVISTFADDEPIESVIESARATGDGIRYAITGNPARLPARVRDAMPANVRLTGFLPEEEYWSLLATSDVVMDLTTMEDCLVCGAYEGISVGRPLVLSNNRASVELFHDAALFTDNSVASLATVAQQAKAQYAELRARMPAARERIDRHWDACAAALVARFQQLAAGAHR